ncbi:hypothetical protein GLYMA_14G159500v4 [Glycine max]|uniref:Uncharacterized protein n=1 Tax=Glycine max TaxID=3847 RepID=A0A0R0GMZ4_SOYBN|nr:hypothetical protein GYH30_040134 [Glycine max]KRH16505.1 hypothetical protein GLYMA_14G159500v4 [Glycine max]
MNMLTLYFTPKVKTFTTQAKIHPTIMPFTKKPSKFLNNMGTTSVITIGAITIGANNSSTHNPIFQITFRFFSLFHSSFLGHTNTPRSTFLLRTPISLLLVQKMPLTEASSSHSPLLAPPPP